MFDKFVNTLSKKDEKEARSNNYPIIIINPTYTETRADDKCFNNENLIDKMSLGLRIES